MSLDIMLHGDFCPLFFRIGMLQDLESHDRFRCGRRPRRRRSSTASSSAWPRTRRTTSSRAPPPLPPTPRGRPSIPTCRGTSSRRRSSSSRWRSTQRRGRRRRSRRARPLLLLQQRLLVLRRCAHSPSQLRRPCRTTSLTSASTTPSLTETTQCHPYHRAGKCRA